jgi:homoserine dehydrogenase
VAEVFERHAVSIRSLEQEELGDEARLVLITHTARERDLQGVLSDLRHLDVVDRVGTMLRVVGR